jgi:hypothetical protein
MLENTTQDKTRPKTFWKAPPRKKKNLKSLKNPTPDKNSAIAS